MLKNKNLAVFVYVICHCKLYSTTVYRQELMLV